MKDEESFLKFITWIFILLSLISFSCSKKGGKTTEVQFSRMFLNGAPTFTGGLGIFGRNDTGEYFTYTLVDDSNIPLMTIPDGEWEFWAIGWESVNMLEGSTKCGMTTASLKGGDLGVSMILSAANCNNADFASAAFMNANQFHPVVITSCHTQTIVDDTTTCDSSFKGEHRSFKFVIDTVSSFGELPNPAPLVSNCFDESSSASGSSTTTVTLPAGSASGFGAPLNVRVEGYPSTGCAGVPEIFDLPTGFDGPSDSVVVYAGASQTKVFIDALNQSAGPINGITISNLTFANVTSANADISFDFTGDSNVNSSATVDFCNETQTAACVLVGGVAMSPVANTYSATITFSGNPSEEIKYNITAVDAEGVTGSFADQSFFIPVPAPSGLTLNTPASSPGSIASPVIDVLGTSLGGTVSLHFLADCSDVSQGSAVGAAGTTSVTASSLVDGSYTFYAKQTINVIESNCSVATASYTYDTAAPTVLSVSIASNNVNTAMAKVGDLVTLTFMVNETLLANPTVTIGGNAATIGGSYPNYTASYTMTGPDTQGVVAFTIDFTDAAGNVATQVSATTDASSVIFDSTIPSVALTVPATSTFINASTDSATFSVSGTCDEAGQNVTVIADGVDQVTIGGVCDGANFSGTFDSTILVDGVIAIEVKISDAAGNLTNSAISNVTKDTVAPTVAITGPANGSYINSATSSSVFSAYGTCSETGQSVTVIADGVDQATVGGVCDGTNFSGTFDSTLLAEGVRNFSVKISDAAGNLTTSGINSVTLDTTPPNFLTFSLDDTVYYYTGEAVDIDVMFDEVVVDSGSSLNLTTGVAPFLTGSGTTNLTYQYIVMEGDSDMLVDYTSTTPFSGTITDLAGNLALPSVATPGSVGSINNDFDLVMLGHGKSLLGGTGNEDNALVAVDSILGDVYVAMTATSSIIDTLSGASDIYIARLNPDGSVLEELQFGAGCTSLHGLCTPGGAEVVTGIYFDDLTGNLYVTGHTDINNFFPSVGAGAGINKPFMIEIYFDPTYSAAPVVNRGAVYRFNQNVVPTALDFDGSSLFAMSGNTMGSLPSCTTGGGAGAEGFLMTLSITNFETGFITCGTFGSEGNDYAMDVKFDASGNAIVLGDTNSVTPNSYLSLTTSAGGSDLYLWQFGVPTFSFPNAEYRLNAVDSLDSSLNEVATRLYIDGGDIYAFGHTTGSDFAANAGGEDALAIKIDNSVPSTLSFLSGFQVGTIGTDRFMDGTVDGLGNVYVLGMTDGAIVGSNTAGVDAFIQKLDISFGSLGATQLDDGFGVFTNSGLNTMPSNLVSLDDKSLIMSFKSDGDIFSTGWGGGTDGGMLLFRMP